VKIRATQSAELRIVVGKVSPLQERIIAEIDARNHVGSHEGDLLGLGEVIIWIAVQHHLTHPLHGNEILWNDFGGIEDIEIKLHFVFLRQNLEAKFPFEVVAFFQ
jgi:hypothetical protein